MPLPLAVLGDLGWMLGHLEEHNSADFLKASSFTPVFTDARGGDSTSSVWAMFMQKEPEPYTYNRAVSGFLLPKGGEQYYIAVGPYPGTGPGSKPISAHRELYTVRGGFQALEDKLAGGNIVIFTDASAGVSAVNKFGSTTSEEMDVLAKEIWNHSFEIKYNIQCAVHIPGRLNTLADAAKREPVFLAHKLVEKIVRVTGIAGPPKFVYYAEDMVFSVGHVAPCIVVLQDTTSLVWKILGDYRSKGRPMVLVVPDFNKVWRVELEEAAVKKVFLSDSEPEYIRASGAPFGWAPKRLIAFVLRGQGC